MTTAAARLDLDKALRDYRRLRGEISIGPIRTKREYDRATRTLDSILDTIGNAGQHPLADLAETIGIFIERYEQQHFAPPDAGPVDVLRFLMDQHGLRQSDLGEIGSQGVVSEILNGRRSLNARQVRRLAERFGVSPAVFL